MALWASLTVELATENFHRRLIFFVALIFIRIPPLALLTKFSESQLVAF